ncbi:triose-phosphate isomerase [Candidatus Blochmannia ocreatus (nom. nud.)]|uniref:Triosephosphate isomerase n=1 Tax=Candidatus Blochmannia ocreatus (nom. nud.) TaxID=251538 RepID=A0ABY4SSW3_9ENTR|nr:triose-phosphate isomerase [Candidatus Blochmannia ocreatus]URJ25067.1 triose-phosphate isomerase [Candidatus Blochmannia ocreatus]
MRNSLIVGNWKLNGNKYHITNSVAKLVELCASISRSYIAIAPPVVYLDMVRRNLRDSCIKLCAQNVDPYISGAFTGDVSPIMLQDLNVKYVLIGHSERRIYHNEYDAYVAQKFCIVKKIGLIPILCIGENKKEHACGYTESVCLNQIKVIIKLSGGTVEVFKDSIIAYEPVWAIGSGVSAVPEEVQMIHKSIRNYIESYSINIASSVRILYGGSVTPENVVNFLNQKDIDGVLIGSASLDADKFHDIIKLSEKLN